MHVEDKHVQACEQVLELERMWTLSDERTPLLTRKLDWFSGCEPGWPKLLARIYGIAIPSYLPKMKGQVLPAQLDEIDVLEIWQFGSDCDAVNYIPLDVNGNEVSQDDVYVDEDGNITGRVGDEDEDD
jgi:hypothetical protein